MNKPIRIQRTRLSGYNMQAQSPDGRPVVSVCRPGKWGNEFKVFVEDELYWVADSSDNIWGKEQGYETHDEAAAYAVRLYANGWLEGKVGGEKLNPYELHGKHLACFCRLDAPCHADVLLQWANEPQFLWHRYDALMRRPASLTFPEQRELAELGALLTDAGIVTQSDVF